MTDHDRSRSPAFHMILPRTIIEVVIPGIILRRLSVLGRTNANWNGGCLFLSFLWTLGSRILLQIRHVMGGVPSLEDSISSSTLLLTLPEEMSSQRFGQFCRQHISSSGAW